MSLCFRTNKEYNQQQARIEKSYHDESGKVADRIYIKALDFIKEIREDLDIFGEYMSDFDKGEIENIAEQLNESVSLEVREYLGREE